MIRPVKPPGMSDKNWEFLQANATRIAAFAEQEGRCYAPATEDLWFKFLTGSDGGGIERTFVDVAVALSFRSSDTAPFMDGSTQILLPSRPNPDRRVATDFACAVKTAGGIAGKQAQVRAQLNDNPAPTVVSQRAVLCDAIQRGLIIFSEMQVKPERADGGQYSMMIDRASDYTAFVQQRDHIRETAAQCPLKEHSDGETSRSVAGVIFEVVSQDGVEVAQSISCPAQEILGAPIDRARGNVATFVPLVNTSALAASDDRGDQFQRQVRGLMKQWNVRVNKYFNDVASRVTDGVRMLVKQVISVINFSHLMWPGLVETFLPEVQDMCKRLKITGGYIMSNAGNEYVQSLIGPFRAVQAAQAQLQAAQVRAEEAEAGLQKAQVRAEEAEAGLQKAQVRAETMEQVSKVLAKLGRLPDDACMTRKKFQKLVQPALRGEVLEALQNRRCTVNEDDQRHYLRIQKRKRKSGLTE